MVGHVYKTSGKNYSVKKIAQEVTLKYLQGIVGGLIQIINLDDDEVMIVNEEGGLLGLPINPTATRIYGDDNSIVGDVLVTKSKYIM